MRVEDEEYEEEQTTNCPDCGGTGIRNVPIYNDWDEVEEWLERRCSYCGGSGTFDAIQASELKAEGSWYENAPF